MAATPRAVVKAQIVEGNPLESACQRWGNLVCPLPPPDRRIGNVQRDIAVAELGGHCAGAAIFNPIGMVTPPPGHGPAGVSVTIVWDVECRVPTGNRCARRPDRVNSRSEERRV